MRSCIEIRRSTAKVGIFIGAFALWRTLSVLWYDCTRLASGQSHQIGSGNLSTNHHIGSCQANGTHPFPARVRQPRKHIFHRRTLPRQPPVAALRCQTQRLSCLGFLYPTGAIAMLFQIGVALPVGIRAVRPDRMPCVARVPQCFKLLASMHMHMHMHCARAVDQTLAPIHAAVPCLSVPF